MEGKQALERAVNEGWITADAAQRLAARKSPPGRREVPLDWRFESRNGALTKVTIRVYNPKDDGTGGGAVE